VCNKKLPKDKEIFQFFSRKTILTPSLTAPEFISFQSGKRGKMMLYLHEICWEWWKTPTCSFLGLRGLGYS